MTYKKVPLKIIYFRFMTNIKQRTINNVPEGVVLDVNESLSIHL